MLEFSPSTPLTVGVELELQLVTPVGFDLTRGAADLLPRLERRKLASAVKPEITESMIELNSGVHTVAEALFEELDATRRAVVAEAGLLNLLVCGGGSHPFHDWSDRRIFPTERFRSVTERYGYLAKQFTVFGQHIHVGCADGDAAVRLSHCLTRFVPHFIALSASSPFYQGQDTSFQSSRLTAVSAFPLAGHIPYVHDWGEFDAFFERMRGFGIVSSMKDFYWDVRPKPEYGTVELRVCDTPLTVRRASALAAYAQAIAAWELHEPAPLIEDLYLVNSFNRFEACRYGVRGDLIDPSTGARKKLGDDILDTLAAVAPHCADAGSRKMLGELRAGVVARESDADWLRARFKESGALSDAVRGACARWGSAAS